MKKIFISQPMAGKTDEQILDERQKAIESVKLHFGKENVEVIDSFITEAPKDAKPLWYLGKSLELMSCADIAVFIGDWRNYRGCNIEYMAAIAYDIELFHFINENKEKCPHCGEAVGADWNFCMYCGGKVKNTCDCWVLNKPYDCGQAKCPGYKLRIQLFQQSKKNSSKNQPQSQ